MISFHTVLEAPDTRDQSGVGRFAFSRHRALSDALRSFRINKLGRADLFSHDGKLQAADLSCFKSTASDEFDIALDDGKAQFNG